MWKRERARERKRERDRQGGKDRNTETKSVKHRHAATGINTEAGDSVSRQRCEEDVVTSTEEEQN